MPRSWKRSILKRNPKPETKGNWLTQAAEQSQKGMGNKRGVMVANCRGAKYSDVPHFYSTPISLEQLGRKECLWKSVTQTFSHKQGQKMSCLCAWRSACKVFVKDISYLLDPVRPQIPLSHIAIKISTLPSFNWSAIKASHSPDLLSHMPVPVALR